MTAEADEITIRGFDNVIFQVDKYDVLAIANRINRGEVTPADIRPLRFWGTLFDLLMAGFCGLMMCGCAYKGPDYDLSTLAGLRPQPIRDRETTELHTERSYSRGVVLSRSGLLH
jgi:hypothetical protein